MRKCLLILTLGLVAFTSLLIWATSDKTEQAHEVATTDKGEAQIGGDFALTDQNGKPTTAADFRGRVMLVFFGFTHCPDECPATAAMFSKTMGLLGDKADMVAPLFITVDPARDTPPVLKDFLSNFDKHIVGLTGSPEQIKQIATTYKTYYARSTATTDDPQAAPKDDANYSIDHSAFIYMMGKDGKYIRLFPYNVSAEELARAIQSYLS